MVHWSFDNHKDGENSQNAEILNSCYLPPPFTSVSGVPLHKRTLSRLLKVKWICICTRIYSLMLRSFTCSEAIVIFSVIKSPELPPTTRIKDTLLSTLLQLLKVEQLPTSLITLIGHRADCGRSLDNEHARQVGSCREWWWCHCGCCVVVVLLWLLCCCCCRCFRRQLCCCCCICYWFLVFVAFSVM